MQQSALIFILFRGEVNELLTGLKIHFLHAP